MSPDERVEECRALLALFRERGISPEDATRIMTLAIAGFIVCSVREDRRAEAAEQIGDVIARTVAAPEVESLLSDLIRRAAGH